MRFNYNKLRGRIVEKLGSVTALCKETEISYSTMQSKLQNRSYFDQKEINILQNALDIPDEELKEYFFCPESSEI